MLSAYNPDGQPWPQIEHDGYLYHYLAYHLHETGRKAELYELLTGSPDWMEAKFVACMGDTAYVADLDLAIGDFTDPLAAAEVLTLVKLYTARQVVNARVSSYSDTDLRTLVWLGREGEALDHVRLRDQAGDRFSGLLAVYNTLKEKDQHKPSLLHEAREAASAINDDRRQWGTLRDLANALTQSGLYAEAREAVSIIGDYVERSKALSSVAAALVQAGDNHRADEMFEEAREAASAIEDDKYTTLGSKTLSSVAAALAQAGRYGEAREVAGSIEDDAERSEARTVLTAALVHAGRYREAREVTSTVVYPFWRSEALSSMTADSAQARRYGKALSSTVAALAQSGRYAEAREVAGSIEGNLSRSEALSSVAIVVARAGDDCLANAMFDEAREAAGTIEDDWRRSEALSSVAAALAQAGDDHQADEVLARRERLPALLSTFGGRCGHRTLWRLP